MEILILITGIIAVIAGILLLFAPDVLIKIGEVMNRVLSTEDVIFSRRTLFGVLFVLAGVYMVYTYFYIL